MHNAQKTHSPLLIATAFSLTQYFILFGRSLFKFIKPNLILLIICMSISLDINAQQLEKVKAFSAFKNGQSFVVKELNVVATQNRFKLSEYPQALFGTYWFSGIDEPLLSVSSKMENFVEVNQRKAIGFVELLHANQEKNIVIHTKDNKTIAGIVKDLELLEESNSQLKLRQQDLSERYGGKYSFDFISPQASQVVNLKSKDKWVSIDINSINRIDFAAKPNNIIKPHITVRKPVITMQFAKNGKHTVEMAYLQNGFSWTPVYRLQLLSDTKANLAMQIEMLNSFADIHDTDIKFVIGVPNFSAAKALATLLSVDKKSYSNLATENHNRFSNKLVLQGQVAAYAPEAPASNSNVLAEDEDLYYYQLNNISMAKGSAMQKTVFSIPIDIKHYYECKINLEDATNGSYVQYVNNTNRGDAHNNHLGGNSTKASVSHYIEITNSSAGPLTSGPILVMQSDRQTPISQTTMVFTPKNSIVNLFVTTAPDIEVLASEKIIDMQTNEKNRYYIANIKNSITAKNTKSKTVELLVKPSISGRVIKSSHSYSESFSSSRPGITDLVFKIQLAPGKETVIDYSYQKKIRF